MLKSSSFETISGFGRLQIKPVFFFFSRSVSCSIALLVVAKFMDESSILIRI